MMMFQVLLKVLILAVTINAYSICYLCGYGSAIMYPSNVVPYADGSSYSCADVEFRYLAGYYTAEDCYAHAPSIRSYCGCQTLQSPAAAPMQRPTGSVDETPAQSFPPPSTLRTSPSPNRPPPFPTNSDEEPMSIGKIIGIICGVLGAGLLLYGTFNFYNTGTFNCFQINIHRRRP